MKVLQGATCLYLGLSRKTIGNTSTKGKYLEVE